MTTSRKFGASSFALGLALLVAAPLPARADTIVKVPLAEAGYDLSFDGTTFGTVDDGNAGTLGDQDTRVVFSEALDAIPDIDSVMASFSLDQVLAVGLAVLNGPVITQQTSGGSFRLWDENNNLLLSGDLSSGALTGTSSASTGSFFNTAFAAFTGGSLAPLLDPTTAGLSIALAGITTAGAPGFQLSGGVLQPFVADGAGLIEGKAAAQVPEPVTGLLLLSGLAAGNLVQRKRRPAA